MKRGVIIFWSLLVGCAMMRVLFSLHQETTSIGACNKHLVIGSGIITVEPERKEGGQVLVVSAAQLFPATTSVHVVVPLTPDSCAHDMLIRMKTKLYPRFAYGDTVSFSGKISTPFNFKSDTGRAFDYIGYLAKDDIFYEIKSAQVESVANHSSKPFSISGTLFYLKRRFVAHLEEVLGEPHAALAAGLVVGEKSALGKDLLNDFRIVGLIHIVVLSGFNITVVGDAMRRILSFLPRVWGITVGGIGIGLFGVMVGGGATVVRSCFMAGVALSADLIRRDYNVTRALIFAALVMLIQNPMILLHNPSFQLSFLATLGLILLASPIEKKLTKIPEAFGVRGIVASTIATQIFVSPYILYMMGSISIIGIIVNILVLPIIPITMLAVFLTGAGGFISTDFAHVFGWVANILLTYELHMVEWFARVPFASVTLPMFSGWWVVTFYALFAAMFWYCKKKKEPAISYDVESVFSTFQKVPKGILVDRPDELISTDFSIPKHVLRLISSDAQKIFFTRRTLKHIAEKGIAGKKMFTRIHSTLEKCNAVYYSKRNNRYILSKSIYPDLEGQSHLVVIELTNDTIIIVTSFMVKQKYLKNFKILWRTAASS